jgi:hypothetical protein
LPDGPVVATHIKPAEDGRGLIVRLLDPRTGDRPQVVPVAGSGGPLRGAWRCDTLEDNQARLERDQDTALCPLPPRQITTLRLRTR